MVLIKYIKLFQITSFYSIYVFPLLWPLHLQICIAFLRARHDNIFRACVHESWNQWQAFGAQVRR